MTLEILYIPVGMLGLVMLLVLVMKSPGSKTYTFNSALYIHPPRLEELPPPKAPDKGVPQITASPLPPPEQEEEQHEPPPPADLEARMRFYQQEAKEEALNQKEKSLDELNEEIQRASRQAKVQAEQNQRDLKNREYYLKQQEKLNSDKNKR